MIGFRDVKTPTCVVLLAALVFAATGCTANPSPSLPTSPPTAIAPQPSPSGTVVNSSAQPTQTTLEPHSTPISSSTPPSAPAAPSASAALPNTFVGQQDLAVRSWSPNGKYLLVRGRDGYEVLDASANPLWGFTAWDAGWYDSDTIAAAGTGGAGAARETVRFYDASGTQTGTLPTVFESVVFAPGEREFAGIYPYRRALSQGDTFSIWDGNTLSATYEGHPVAWSPDGSRLAVLVAPWGPSRPGMEGHFAVLDAGARPVAKPPGWMGPTVPPAPYAFSPDGRYAAACLTKDPNALESSTLVDTQTAAVTELAQRCAGTPAWSNEPALYTRDDSGQPVRWTSNQGPVPISGTDSTDVVVPAPNGSLAVWSANTSDLRLIVDGEVHDYGFPDNIIGVAWRPDSNAVAVVYGDTTNGTGRSTLTIIGL